MIIPIVYPSALQFWMDSNLINHADSHAISQRILTMLPDHYHLRLNPDIISRLSDRYGFTLPIHVLCPDKASRRETPYCTSTLRSAHLPPMSFLEIDKITRKHTSDIYHIYLASPELCFLEAASTLSLWELIKLGYDLCAIYLPDNTSEYLQIGRKVITTVESIANYLSEADQVYGIKKARQACKYILDRSNSPMETKIAMLMTLPMRLGGYGIIKPELNKKIVLSAQGKSILHRDYCISDMVWETSRIIVEYDSNQTHLTPEQHELDKARQTALTLSGYKVITLTAENLRSFSNRDQTFLSIRSQLGMHREVGRLNQYTEIRRSLYEFLREQ